MRLHELDGSTNELGAAVVIATTPQRTDARGNHRDHPHP
jgi:hypothetical protein